MRSRCVRQLERCVHRLASATPSYARPAFLVAPLARRHQVLHTAIRLPARQIAWAGFQARTMRVPLRWRLGPWLCERAGGMPNPKSAGKRWPEVVRVLSAVLRVTQCAMVDDCAG